MLAAPVVQAQKPKIVVLGADDPTWVNDVKTKIAATGLFDQVDNFDIRQGTPTLSFLNNYSAAIFWTDATPSDPNALGNVIADFSDAGGGVVMSTFATGGHGLEGRFNTAPYWVIQPTSFTSSPTLQLGTIPVPNHPVMQGVNTFKGGSSSYRGTSTTFTTGSLVVANWSNGSPLVVVKENVGAAGARRVDLNFFPPSSAVRADFWDASTDGAKLMANALVWVSNYIKTANPANTAYCANQTLSIPFVAAVSKNFNSDNIYTAQLSDAAGSFGNPVAIGTLSGTMLSGAINATLPNNLPTGAGYKIRVVSSSPVINGAPHDANLAIGPPVITAQPQSIKITTGNTTSFTVAANGAGLTYQWQLDQGAGFTNINNGGSYAGADAATLNVNSLSSEMHGTKYRCVVTGYCSPAATSDAATLTLKLAPALTNTSLTLSTLEEDLAIDANPGILVSDLISGAASSSEANSLGIAVTSREGDNGTWQFFQSGLWYNFDRHENISAAKALLLPATTRIRFVPATNYYGAAAFTFRAWDQTTGTAYDVANTTVNGGATTYSAATGTASVTISTVNDAPVISGTVGTNYLSFDGARGYVSMPALQFGGDHTIEAWVFVTQHQTWSRIAEFGNGPGNNNVMAAFRGGNNDLWMETYNNSQGGGLATNQVFPTGVWKHVAAVNNGSGTGTLYIDGQAINSGTQKIPAEIIRTLNYLGKSNFSQDSYFKGKMREVRIWDVARTQAQIREYMHKPLGGNEPGLKIYYKFNEGTGTVLTDASSNGKNGTIQDGATWGTESTPLTSITTAEDTEAVISGLQAADIDAGNGVVTFTLTVSNGIIKIKDDVASGLAASQITQNNSKSVTVNASLAEINATLSQNGLVYAPALNFNGQDNAIITLNDNGLTGAGGNLTSTLNLVINVDAVNDNPVITSTSPATSVFETAAYSYTLTATDADANETLTFSAPVKPNWLSFNAQTGVLSGAPTKTDVGIHAVTLQVNDGKISTSQTFTITVSPLALPPVITGITIDSGVSIKDGVTAANKITLVGTAEENVEVKVFEAGLGELGIASLENDRWIFTYPPVLNDGTYTFTATATNTSGLSGPASAAFTVVVDTQNPETTIVSGPVAIANTNTATFNFSSNEEPATFQMSLNGAAFAPAISPMTLTGLADGAYTLAARASDLAGNTDVTPATYTWTVDTTAPTINITAASQALVNAAFPVTLTFSEAVTDFDLTDISLTNATASAFVQVSESVYTALITPTQDGEVKVALAAIVAADAATNGNVTSNVFTKIYDGTQPTGYGIAILTNRVTVANVREISLQVNDAEIDAQYYYTITSEKGGEQITGTGTVAQARFTIPALDLTLLNDGQLTVTFYLQDAAGNKGEATTAQVMKYTKDVIAVTRPVVYKAPIRTAFEQLALPAKVEVTYSSGTKEEIGVIWLAGNYNGLVAGVYTLTGNLVLAPGTTNLENIQAEITVEVQPNKVPTGLALSATSFSPNIIATEAIGNFSTTDADDTEHVYALANGPGDTHNHLFQIIGNKIYLKSTNGLSGQTQFTIRVITTDPYHNKFEREFKLTKSAYAKAATELKIVNAFTPNGDGVNDEWAVPELKYYNKVSIEVFDQSGVRLFQTTNPEKGWDGRNKHGQVLQGAFLYVIQVEDIQLVKKGVVTVLKK
ncbi:hypothetical protein AAE02nite_14320 [Adhaeribacter aerolatus]|uniref:Uncharacterized protein n=1 Tax=Adhaeribacter aerolatus TaxID=670289 RepID=A0A512AVL9_9BACT|nr:LamG-like jellyroll fold domain-containing protein [Adhaeribacter aerolatus]GEO03768.1 hypothetical protein AAE02nite_14320 [Adhaeribacter aerolatus]